MNLKELRQSIEKNGHKEAEEYLPLFDTNLYDVLKSLKKVDSHLMLNTIAYAGQKFGSGYDVKQQLYVVYSITTKKGTYDVAIGCFSVKEKEMEYFLECAQSGEVLSLVELNLVQPERVEIEIASNQKVDFKTIALNAKEHSPKILLDISDGNDALWRIVEDNYKFFIKEEQNNILEQIKQQKFLRKEIKKDMHLLNGSIKQQQAFLESNEGSTKQLKTLEMTKDTLKKRQESYNKGGQIIDDLKNRKKGLKQQKTNVNLSEVFGDKK